MVEYEKLPYNTKGDRQIIYQYLKAIYEKSHVSNLWGMCFHVRNLIAGDNVLERFTLIASRDADELRAFPELLAQKPEKMWTKFYWFALSEEGVKKRIECIDKAIELCNK